MLIIRRLQNAPKKVKYTHKFYVILLYEQEPDRGGKDFH